MAYLSYDSLFLADWLKRALRRRGRPRRRALDLCTGVGILACVMADHCDYVVGTDVNPRSLAYARVNAEVNGIANVDFAAVDLFDGIRRGEDFDLIISNPPWVLLPDSMRSTMLDSYGGRWGIEITSQILSQMPAHLSREGMAIVLSKAPIVEGRDLLWEEVAKHFSPSKWRVDYTVLCPTPIPVPYAEWYHAQGISRLQMVVLCLTREIKAVWNRHEMRIGVFRYGF